MRPFLRAFGPRHWPTLDGMVEYSQAAKRETNGWGSKAWSISYDELVALLKVSQLFRGKQYPLDNLGVVRDAVSGLLPYIAGVKQAVSKGVAVRREMWETSADNRETYPTFAAYEKHLETDKQVFLRWVLLAVKACKLKIPPLVEPRYPKSKPKKRGKRRSASATAASLMSAGKR